MHRKGLAKLEACSDGRSLNVPPSANEIEVSVFGPGYGECVVLHMGNNNWFIVDSCIDQQTREPAALKYLNLINIDPSTAVKQLIATHWHDDHIRGFGKTLKACESAQLVCSSALQPEEFRKLVYAFSTRAMLESSGTDEFRSVMEILKERMEHGSRVSRPVFAIQDRRLWKGDTEGGGIDASLEIDSLSPSDSAILASKADFSKLMPSEGESKRWLPPITPNMAAVVLSLKMKNFSILLGSDLEENKNDPYSGWSMIVSSHSPQNVKSSIFKVSHHGSVNGDHPGIWSEMLRGNPIAVLTPWQKGGRALPTSTDIQRLISNTQNGFSTCSATRRSIRRDHTIDKSIKEVVKNIKQMFPPSGHVRIRVREPNDMKIELFGDACRLG